MKLSHGVHQNAGFCNYKISKISRGLYRRIPKQGGANPPCTLSTECPQAQIITIAQYVPMGRNPRRRGPPQPAHGFFCIK